MVGRREEERQRKNGREGRRERGKERRRKVGRQAKCPRNNARVYRTRTQDWCFSCIEGLCYGGKNRASPF